MDLARTVDADSQAHFNVGCTRGAADKNRAGRLLYLFQRQQVGYMRIQVLHFEDGDMDFGEQRGG